MPAAIVGAVVGQGELDVPHSRIATDEHRSTQIRKNQIRKNRAPWFLASFLLFLSFLSAFIRVHLWLISLSTASRAAPAPRRSAPRWSPPPRGGCRPPPTASRRAAPPGRGGRRPRTPRPARPRSRPTAPRPGTGRPPG